MENWEEQKLQKVFELISSVRTMTFSAYKKESRPLYISLETLEI